MTHEKRRILQMLDEIVRSERVRSHLEPIVERVRRELAQKTEALMTWEPVPLTVFSDALPAEIRSGWIFVLRAGTDTGAERHPNSHQRMMTFAGTGDMKIDIKCAKNDVASESEIEWRSNVLVSDRNASLEQRWISIPANVWHRPVIPTGADWAVVSFHTVPADELIEERPGAQRMLYETERKRADQAG
jgi:hypothetical protein